MSEEKKKHGKYEEPKKRVNVALTQTSINLLDDQAERLNMSRSEVIEQMARFRQLTDPNVQLLGECLAS